RMARAVLGAQAFDGDDLGAIGLHRKRQARARAAAVHRDGAGTADAVFAAQMRAGEMQMIAEKIGKRQPHRHGLLVGPAVHGYIDFLLARQFSVLPPAPTPSPAPALPSRRPD